METLNNNRKADIQRIIAMMLCCVLCCSVFVLGNAQMAFCGSVAQDIGDAVETLSDNAYQTMRAIVIPLLIVWVAVAGFQFMLGGSQGTEKARKSLIAAVVCLALVVFAPVIGKSLGDMFKDQGAADFGTYNPLK